jgi:hypothetical protein
MRTAIIGSRTFNDLSLALVELDKFDITHVVSGGAKGADTIAEQWAYQKEIETTVHYPNWSKHGKAAGFIRNKAIIDDCEQVIAFWDGHSKGTENSINIARASKKPCHIILV